MFCTELIIIEIVLFLYAHIYPNIKENIGKKALNILFLILYSVIIANRPIKIPDQESYKWVFDIINPYGKYGFDPLGELFSVEYGYLYFIKIFKHFSNNIIFFYFILSFFTVLFFVVGAKLILSDLGINFVNIPILLLLYISYYGTYYGAIACRQALEISLGVFSLGCIVSKRYKTGILSLLLGFTFHRFAILLIIVIFIYLFFNKSVSRKAYYITIFLAIVLLAISSTGILNNLLMKYIPRFIAPFSGSYYGYFRANLEGSTHLALVNVYVCIVGIIVLQLSTSVPKMYKLMNIYFAGIIISIILNTLKGSARIYDHFTVFSIIMLSTCYYTNGLTTDNRSVTVRLNNILIIFILIINNFLFINVVGWL